MHQSLLYSPVTLIGACTSRQYHSVFNAPKIVQGSAGHFYYPMKAKPLPMQLIQEAFEIDLSCPSGLRWKVRPRTHFNSDAGWRRENTKNAGTPAGSLFGSLSAEPRYYVCVSYNRLQASRIIYALTYGNDPHPMDIDHRDGNVLNNSPSNLRIATRRQNGWNRRNKSNNKSGYSGVFFNSQRQKWCARIVISGITKHLGFYDDVEDAINARKLAESELHGEFAKQVSREL